MDIPILSNLEKIYPNKDTGAEAIRKLVKNQNLIEQGIKEIDDLNDTEALQEQINVLSSNLKTKIVDYSLIDQLLETENYMFLGNGTDGFANGALINLQIIAGKFDTKASVTQIATTTYQAGAGIYMKFRTFYLGVWSPWQQIATTEKVSFSPTPLTGFTVLNNASYIQNGIAHINLKVKKDSGYFDTTTTAMCTLPFASKIPDSPFTSVFGEHGVSYKEIAYNVFANSSTIYVRVATTNSVNFVNLIGEVIIA